jgi:hypothetical protein
LDFVFVVSSSNHRCIGHGLDVVEAFRDGLFFGPILFSLGPTFVPLGFTLGPFHRLEA